MRGPKQYLGFAPILDPLEYWRQRVAAAESRLKRAKKRHDKDVMMVDPKLADHLVNMGFAEECKVSDYDEALDRRFRFDPRHHKPIRIKRIRTNVL